MLEMPLKNNGRHNKTKIGGLGFTRKIETVWKKIGGLGFTRKIETVWKKIGGLGFRRKIETVWKKIGGLGFRRKIETVWKKSWKKTRQKQLASSDFVLLTDLL